jgi:uncharacterized membrane protein YjgN (DUF898 family)
MSDQAATIPPRRAARDSAGFLGDDRDYWRLMTRGAALLMVTLGLYRFWLATDMRRFLWSNSEISGDTLEYIGTPAELLLGFLIAVTVLVPLYAVFFVAALDLGVIGQISGVLAFALLAFLGQFAIYRARRYRLTRTVYRGVRFRQTGSAWRYAVCALFWWSMTILTFGLAYPWAQLRLEQFKMGNTFYGDLPGHFEGSAWWLFLRGLPLWFLVMTPLVVGLVLAVGGIDWTAAIKASQQGGDDVLGRIEGAAPGFGAAIVIVVLALGWAVFTAAMLYPAFQALMLRWWLGGLRFGSVAAVSQVRTGQIYGVYVRFLWYSVLFSLVAGVVATVALLVIGLLEGMMDSMIGEILVTVMLLAGYVIAALAYSTIYQVTVKLGLWRLGLSSLTLSGTGALDRVKAVGRPSSSFGEGLANALRVDGW